MSALRSLRLSALCHIILGLTCAAAPVLAQAIDDPVVVRGPFHTDPNPLWRTPALIGMGELTMGDDQNNHLELWDFARNPAGIFDADSTTTIQLRPGVQTASAQQTMPLGDPRLIHQTLDTRQGLVGYEVWRRTNNGNAYGFYGDVVADRFAHPYDETQGESARLNTPGGTLAVNGKVPFWGKGRMQYAFRGTYTKGKTEDVFSQLAVNPTGFYLDKGGVRLAPPNLLVPDQSKNTYVGAGGALSYRFGAPLTAALGGDYLEERMAGANEGERNRLQTTEKRPYGLGQATLMGRIGKHVEWIADGRTWQASNQNRYDFTLSAGTTQLPLAGRGLAFSRFEEGTQMRTRARWQSGAWELGATFDTWYQRVRIGAPDPSDPNSYNAFLNTIFYRPGADSLAIPDSVRTNQTDVRGYDYGLGGFRGMGKHGGRFGVEYHWLRSRTDQTTSGPGPQLQGWDVRTGLEYPCAPLLRGRAGYIYRRWDGDTFTQQNEYITQTVTGGIGIGPATSHWGVELAYAYEWGGPDYSDPYGLWGHQQQFAAQLRWTL
ncbi:MAG: hypothetical protein ACHQ52_04335 [Candidatus Eisenbacteria bacterium]